SAGDEYFCAVWTQRESKGFIRIVSGAIISADPQLHSCGRVVCHRSVIFKAEAAAGACDKHSLIVGTDRHCHRSIGTLGTIVNLAPEFASCGGVIAECCIVGWTEAFTKPGDKHSPSVVAYSDRLTHIKVITRTSKTFVPKRSRGR